MLSFRLVLGVFFGQKKNKPCKKTLFINSAVTRRQLYGSSMAALSLLYGSSIEWVSKF